MKFEVYDLDDGKNDDFIGAHETTLAKIAREPDVYSEELKDEKNKFGGRILIRNETVNMSQDEIKMKYKCLNLP